MRPRRDDVDVGRQDAALADDRALLVGLALECLGDLGGVHLALEDAGERQTDHALEASLEALQHTHSRSFALGRTSRCANGDRSRAARRRDRPEPATPRTHLQRVVCAGQRPTPRPGHGPRLIMSSLARASGGMADAHGSGPCVRKDVGVQLPPCPPSTTQRPRPRLAAGRGSCVVRVSAEPAAAAGPVAAPPVSVCASRTAPHGPMTQIGQK